ncbi:MAG TPA: hypothetical protein VGD80_16005 [Kofleriaceae bacterium]
MKVVLFSVFVAVAILLLARLVGRMPADCDDVAEQLASFELGNYAEPEDRAPVADKHRAVCRREGVTRDEAVCLDKARSRFAGARCVPRLFPDIAMADCDGAACMAASVKQFATQMCACSPGDRACYDKVSGQMTTWAQEIANARAGEPMAPMSQQDTEAMRDASTRYTECMTRVLAVQ